MISHVRQVVAVAAAALLSGCYATNPVYPSDFSPVVGANDMCAAVPGVYSNRGEAAAAEKLPNFTPELAQNLLLDGEPARDADRVELILASDAGSRTLTARAYRGATVLGESGFTDSPSGLECEPGRAVIVPLSVELYKAESGDLVLHRFQRPLLYLAMPRQFAEANWARFPPLQ